MNMLLTAIVLFVGFGAFIVIGARLLIKAFPPSAEDIERSKSGKDFFTDDDIETSSCGVNIDNDIDGGIWS